MSGRRAVAANALLACAAFAVALLLGEALLRMLNRRPYHWEPEVHPWSLPDPVLGWVNRPGLIPSRRVRTSS